jgi:hypothetical protein
MSNTDKCKKITVEKRQQDNIMMNLREMDCAAVDGN